MSRVNAVVLFGPSVPTDFAEETLIQFSGFRSTLFSREFLQEDFNTLYTERVTVEVDVKAFLYLKSQRASSLSMAYPGFCGLE